jgi:hypothetical protein
LRAAGLIFAGRLPPLKARLLLDLLLRAGIDRDTMVACSTRRVELRRLLPQG